MRHVVASSRSECTSRNPGRACSRYRRQRIIRQRLKPSTYRLRRAGRTAGSAKSRCARYHPTPLDLLRISRRAAAGRTTSGRSRRGRPRSGGVVADRTTWPPRHRRYRSASTVPIYRRYEDAARRHGAGTIAGPRAQTHFPQGAQSLLGDQQVELAPCRHPTLSTRPRADEVSARSPVTAAARSTSCRQMKRPPRTSFCRRSTSACRQRRGGCSRLFTVEQQVIGDGGGAADGLGTRGSLSAGQPNAFFIDHVVSFLPSVMLAVGENFALSCAAMHRRLLAPGTLKQYARGRLAHRR